MACGTVVVESVKLAGFHLDCTTEPCLSPSLAWLSPTRISFSKDFATAAPEGADDNIIKATDNMLKGKERSGDRDSMSEFEFAMSIMESENANGKHMLAADELFFKGKLLPLYIPQYIDGSEQQLSQCASLDISDQLEHISARKSSDQKVPTKRSALSAAAVNGGAVTPTVNTKELIQPTSPKTPKCSTKLRELFGLKKAVKPHSSSAASQDAAAASSSSCKSSRSSSSKQKAAILQEKQPLALSKAKRMFCRSDDGSKVLEARNSTSEPLLTACVGGSEMQFGCPVISFQPHHQAHHQQYKKSQMINVASSSSCSNACNLARIQRSNRVSDHAEEGSSIRSSQQQQQLLLRVKVRSNENIRSSASRRVVNQDSEAVWMGIGGSGNGVMRGLTRSLMQGAGSGETSPTRRLSGAMSPAGSSGHWSPGRHSAGALMSGWGSHSGTRYSPGRLSLGESSCMEASHGRLMRARSLERSSSYSPKSLQRRYDELKAMRQREGWRSLERSSSYNNNMNSVVRVAPVLNVPVVCIRSSKNSSNSSSSRSSGGGGGFGLGHLNLFSTKNSSSSNNLNYINGGNSSKLDHSRTPSSSKVLQQPIIKVFPSRRPPPSIKSV